MSPYEYHQYEINNIINIMIKTFPNTPANFEH